MTDTSVSASSTRDPLGLSGVRELAVLERSGLIESRHFGAAVVLSPDGTVEREIGDGTALVYPRSALKPLQAITVMRSGVDLTGEQAVLATASHSGTKRHVRVVRAMLQRAGLSESDLGCPADWPSDADALFDARREGVGARAITMNCSGKHAGFLMACAANGWSTHDYLDPEHPLQRAVRRTVEEFTGQSVGHLGVDGCGAPLFAVGLRGLARALGLVAGAGLRHGDEHAASLMSSILEHPWAIAGPGRANTVVIEQLGILAKGGAEGVIAMATPTGAAVAVKVFDGSHRVTTLIALELLASVGAINRADADRVIALTVEPVLGGGIPVGRLRMSDEYTNR
ncbi:asparaginase [Parafrigoribacterium mesophilum]|uniref:asparaginase n=1 Tax=Parafrigoribacterium mesophilum TaxID=433646 RepID=UPI0031FC3C3C